MVKIKVTVNRAKCIACGVAPSLCGKVFELGQDNGKNKVVDAYAIETTADTSVGEVPEELYECVKTAAESCPVAAITVERVND